MTAQEQIHTLLKTWVAAANAGRKIPLTELCKDCPEHIPELEQRIEQLIAKAKANANRPPSGDTKSSAAPVADGTHVQQPSMPESPTLPLDGYPAQLGGYQLTKVLGEGGMGRVYLAEDVRLGRKIAIKVMKPEVAADEQNRLRFLREARATATLEHDHIVSIFQVGEEHQIPFLVMPLLKGESLDDRLKRDGKLPLKLTVRIAREMAEGLAIAHEQNLIHRDIKPGNVWLEGERARVKILDFGLARGIDAEHDLTHTGAVMGTPAYMAPEQANGEKVDFRADLFSLGCVIYQMLSGTKPFTGGTVYAIMAALSSHHPTPLIELVPNTLREFSDLVQRLLAKKSADRPGSTWDVVNELRRVEDRLTAPTVTPLQMTPSQMTPSQPLPLIQPLTGDDPWAGIDDDTELLPAAPRSQSRSPATPSKSSKKLLLAGVGGLLVLLLGFIVIKITNKDGSVTELKVPDDSQIEISKGGKTIAVVPGNKKDDRTTKVGPVKREPWKVPETVGGPSPLDKLDPKQIPASERFDWQPKELVAVIGEHRRRLWHDANVALSPDGKWCVTSGDYRGLKVFDVKTGDEVGLIPFPKEVSPDFTGGVLFRPDGTGLIFSAGSNSGRPRGFYRVDFKDGRGKFVTWEPGKPIAPLEQPVDMTMYWGQITPDGRLHARAKLQNEDHFFVYDLRFACV